MKRNVLISLLMLSQFVAGAQNFNFGFIAGMNFNKFDGPVETNDQGTAVEEFDWNKGFLVGATFAWEPTDLMGIRGEFQYSQKGSKRSYDGPSYYWFTNTNGSRIFTSGTRKIDIDVSNSYLSLPVVGFIKPLKWIEFYAGANIGFMITSSAFGELSYEGNTTGGTSIQKFNHEIDANYFSDFPLKMSFASPPATVQVGSEKVNIPQSGGAYFEFKESRGKLFRVPEAGLVGGISIYFNKGLFLTLRANKGLTDVTKDKADVSLRSVDTDKQFISRKDSDKNLSFQVGLGFTLNK
jgi:opacity protein-like surface antigen